jgi:hypothetical protein
MHSRQRRSGRDPGPHAGIVQCGSVAPCAGKRTRVQDIAMGRE